MTKSTKKPQSESSSRRLQKFKRNQIFDAIKGAGLDPKEFDIEDGDAEVQIKHRWSESHFIVGGDAGQYVGSYVTGDWPASPYDAYSWESVMQRVKTWLTFVKLDLETPDLWAELRNEAVLFGPAFGEGAANTRFTNDERSEIAQRLQEAVQHARQTYSLSEAQMQVINAKLDYLVNAAGRLGRVDWLNTCVGAMLGILFTAALPPEAVRQILLTVLRGVVQFFPALPGV